MNAHLIGEISLSISSFVYFIWFLPQLWMNYKCKNMDGLSLWMHGLLLLGYSADLLYGFGRHMQWQYRAITIVGLIFLFIQHLQFARYDLHSKSQITHYKILSFLVILVFGYALYNFVFIHHSKQYYDISGFISDMCWMTYLFPQIIKNFVNKSVKGLSVTFVILTLLLTVLDGISTFALHWDWPSVLNIFISLAKKSILVFQVLYYGKGEVRGMRYEG